MNTLRIRLDILAAILILLLVALVAPVSAQGPLPPRPSVEVPEADTLVLLLTGSAGTITYLWWRWRKH